MFSLFLTFAKSNDITNIFVKSTLVQKIGFSSIYDITMSPEHFETQNKDLCPKQTQDRKNIKDLQKKYRLGTVS